MYVHVCRYVGRYVCRYVGVSAHAYVDWSLCHWVGVHVCGCVWGYVGMVVVCKIIPVVMVLCLS